jgi:4'-phosphopantetheinyl transferase EntD
MLVAFLVGMAMTMGPAQATSAPGQRQAATEVLTQAEQAVREAQEKHALWTTAAEALQLARAAHAKEDFGEAQRLARIAIEQSRLGIAQLQYPPLRF